MIISKKYSVAAALSALSIAVGPAVAAARRNDGPALPNIEAVQGAGQSGVAGTALLDSLRETRGFERALDYAFYQVAAVNGFDSFGHYLRAGLIVNQCSTYAVNPTPGCTANFAPASATSDAFRPPTT